MMNVKSRALELTTCGCCADVGLNGEQILKTPA